MSSRNVPEKADALRRRERAYSVCNHAEREAIDEAFVSWQSPTQIAACASMRFVITRRTCSTVSAAFGESSSASRSDGSPLGGHPKTGQSGSPQNRPVVGRQSGH